MSQQELPQHNQMVSGGEPHSHLVKALDNKSFSSGPRLQPDGFALLNPTRGPFLFGYSVW